jgi:hypothetical protein
LNVVNSAGKTFSNLPKHKLNIELGELGLKKRHMIQHGIYHKGYAYFVQRERKSQPVMSKIYGLVMGDCSYKLNFDQSWQEERNPTPQRPRMSKLQRVVAKCCEMKKI